VRITPLAKDKSQTIDPQDFLPLSPTDFQVLLVLIKGPAHGYGIMKEVESGSGGRVRIELGSLYRLIARLLTNGMIGEASDANVPPHAGKKRRTYEITELGLVVARAEAERLRDTVALAHAEKLFAGPRGNQ
jgi:DNA-binding PadR family transcriptional regulator